VAVLLTALFVAVVPAGYPDSVDAGSRLLQSRALAGHASLSIPSEIRGDCVDGIYRSADGLWYSKYGIGLPLLWTVPVAMANAASRCTGVQAGALAGFAVSFVNPVLIAATIGSLLIILRRCAAAPAAQAATVAVFALGTTTLPYANSCWSEPLVGLLILWSVAVPLLNPESNRAAFAAGLLASAATLVKPEMALLAGPLLLLFLGSWRRSAAFATGASLGPLAVLTLNGLITGSVFGSAYSTEATRFGDPRPGLLGMTFGAERSVFVFLPGLLLGLSCWCIAAAPGRLRSARACVLAAAGLYFALYAAWHCWWGGLCFGPRFLYPLTAIASLPVGPSLCAWTGRLEHRAASAVVWTVLSLALLAELPIQLSGMCVKDHQAAAVSEITHEPQWLSQMKLLSLKLRRGFDAPEQYRKSDFVALTPGEGDVSIDHSRFRTYQYLNHWWSILLANRARYSRTVVASP
jgi:hypothetical protein